MKLFRNETSFFPCYIGGKFPAINKGRLRGVSPLSKPYTLYTMRVCAAPKVRFENGYYGFQEHLKAVDN